MQEDEVLLVEAMALPDRQLAIVINGIEVAIAHAVGDDMHPVLGYAGKQESIPAPVRGRDDVGATALKGLLEALLAGELVRLDLVAVDVAEYEQACVLDGFEIEDSASLRLRCFCQAPM